MARERIKAIVLSVILLSGKMTPTGRKCPECKRLIGGGGRGGGGGGGHVCHKCPGCKRRFVNLDSHKCGFRRCQKCDKKIVIGSTTTHTCKAFVCKVCEQKFSNYIEMRLHKSKGHMFSCEKCNYATSNSRILAKHTREIHRHGGSNFRCPYCPFGFNQLQRCQEHILSHAQTDLPLSQRAFNSSCVSYGTRFKNHKYTSVAGLFSRFDPQLKAILKCSIQAHKSLKASIVLFAVLHKYDSSTGALVAENEFIFRSKQKEFGALSNDEDMDELLSGIRESAAEQYDGYCDLEGSGWVFEYISGLYLEISGCRPLTGGCSSGEKFHSENIWDGDCGENECFFIAVARHFHDRSSATEEQIIDYAREWFSECLDLKPMSVSKIGRFERKYDLSINVLLLQSGELYPIQVSKTFDSKPIQLLMIPQSNNPDKYHFVYVTNLASLISELRHALKRRATVHTCINCLNFFTYSKGLENHRKICQEHDAQRIEMPKQDSFVEFSKVAAIQKIPIIGAFDFETKMAPGRGETSKSKNLASHQVVSFSIVLLTMNNEIIYERYEQDEALCLSLFIDALRDINKVIADSIKNQVGIIITEAQEESHRSAQLCYICGKNYESDYKVKDHCHFTGIYFGASHNQCNLQRKQNFRVPVYAHNFSGYDSHFLLQAISQHKTPTDYISVLAYNSQRIRTLTYNKINFIDSMHFVSDSLGNITRDLTSSGHDFSILKKSGLFNSEEQLQLLLRKGVFPYELLTSLKKFRKMEAFPPRESFYSGLYEKHASPADYEHGKKVFETFKCQNMAQYLKLYNILDVYLLLEAITAFRNVGWTEFGLDAAHFISLPQFGFQW